MGVGTDSNQAITLCWVCCVKNRQACAVRPLNLALIPAFAVLSSLSPSFAFPENAENANQLHVLHCFLLVLLLATQSLILLSGSSHHLFFVPIGMVLVTLNYGSTTSCCAPSVALWSVPDTPDQEETCAAITNRGSNRNGNSRRNRRRKRNRFTVLVGNFYLARKLEFRSN